MKIALKILLSAISLFVVIFLIGVVYNYNRVSSKYNDEYKRYSECQKCMEKGESAYKCALSVADRYLINEDKFSSESLESQKKNLVEEGVTTAAAFELNTVDLICRNSSDARPSFMKKISTAVFQTVFVSAVYISALFGGEMH